MINGEDHRTHLIGLAGLTDTQRWRPKEAGVYSHIIAGLNQLLKEWRGLGHGSRGGMGGVDVSPSPQAINKRGDWRQRPIFNQLATSRRY